MSRSIPTGGIGVCSIQGGKTIAQIQYDQWAKTPEGQAVLEQRRQERLRLQQQIADEAKKRHEKAQEAIAANQKRLADQNLQIDELLAHPPAPGTVIKTDRTYLCASHRADNPEVPESYVLRVFLDFGIPDQFMPNRDEHLIRPPQWKLRDGSRGIVAFVDQASIQKWKEQQDFDWAAGKGSGSRQMIVNAVKVLKYGHNNKFVIVALADAA